MTKKEIVAAITAEIERATETFPSWPMPGWPMEGKRIEEAAIIAEEAFEALQVALNMRIADPNRGGPKGTEAAYKKELIQAGAMVFRALRRL